MITPNIFNRDKNPEPFLKEALLEAKNNEPAAQYRLGLIYETGCCMTNSNLKKALKWYFAAAENGHAGAQYVLSHCFEYGKGIDANLDDAIHWAKLAAKNHHPNAKEKLMTLVAKTR